VVQHFRTRSILHIWRSLLGGVVFELERHISSLHFKISVWEIHPCVGVLGGWHSFVVFLEAVFGDWRLSSHNLTCGRVESMNINHIAELI
jgi:hypothetical protein